MFKFHITRYKMSPIQVGNCSLVTVGQNINIAGNTFVIKDSLKANGAKWNSDNKVWYFENVTIEDAQKYVQDAIEQRQGSNMNFELEDEDYIPSSVNKPLKKRMRKESDEEFTLETPTRKSPRLTPSRESPVQFSTLRKSPRKYGQKAPEVKQFTYKQIERYLIRAKEKWNRYVKKSGMTTQKIDLKKACIKMLYVGYKEKDIKYHIVIRYCDKTLEKYASRIASYLTSKGLDVIHEKGSKAPK